MDANEKLRNLRDTTRFVRKLRQWMDKKKASGVPASPEELEFFQEVKLELAELKQSLKVLRADDEEKSEPPSATQS